jgi:hypothetical protein
VAEDMAAQDRWTRYMEPRRGAMLKFRPPYIDAGGPATLEYVRGRVLWQTWPAQSSTEGRLVIEAADAHEAAPPMRFDARRYQDACAVHNFGRAWSVYAPPAPGLEAVPGYDRCFDCTNEAAAWRDYARLSGAARRGVAALMRDLTQVTHQRLDMPEKPGGARTTARVGKQWHGLLAHSTPAVRIAATLGRLEEAQKARTRGSARGGAGPKTYAVISGEVPGEVRDAIRVAFNAPANAHGAVIKAVLVSKTGAEGLDLKYIRETHVVEAYWDMARLDQVKSRAVRLGSHDGLPREERVVQPYVYLAVANQRAWEQIPANAREEKTIDEQFYERALEKYELNNAFRQLLTEVSLECSLFGYGNCRLCAPTNAPLYRADPALDVRLPDPCELRQESEVAAKPVEVGGVTYYYVVDPASPLGYIFYAYRADLGGYAPLDPSDPAIPELLRAVGAAEKGAAT